MNTRTRLPPRRDDGVILFDAAGRAIAASAGEPDVAERGVVDLDDLAGRFSQPDGFPVTLAGSSRQVAATVSEPRRRVLLVTEPLTPIGHSDFVGTAVALVAVRDEDDPQTLLRALGSVLAHELRTPLTTVYAGAGVLAGTAASQATRIEAAGAVAREADRLIRTVEDLIVLVRWEVDALPDAEPMLLQRLVGAVVERRRAVAGCPPIDIAVEPSLPPIHGRPAHVEHVLRIVLDHAIANGPPDGRVQVATRRAGPDLEVGVRDAGPGRDEQAAATAFDLFPHSTRVGGDPSGANLAMVVARRLVERMGGRIRAEPLEHGGETVVTLPPGVPV